MYSEDDFIRLDEHLCFSLYACSRAIQRLYRPFLDEINVTYVQYLVLLVLWEQAGGDSSVKALGEALDLDSGTLTPLLKRMEQAQLIRRSRDPQDERVVRVQLTEQGEQLKEKAICIPRSLLAASGLNPDELQALNQSIRLLNRVFLNMEHERNEK